VGSVRKALQHPSMIAPLFTRVSLIFTKLIVEVAAGMGRTELRKNSYETSGIEPTSKITASRASVKFPLL
jgi:hypothetical protein